LSQWKFTLSLFDPNTLLPHRAGIAGLALALSALDPKDAPLQWEVTEDAVNLAWQGSDREAVEGLLHRTYQIRDGYLHVPALKLDRQGRYTFGEGLLSTFLQHVQHRKLAKDSVSLSFQIDENQPEVKVSYKPILECFYVKPITDTFTSKGQFKPKISIKGNILPGLTECFINGPYAESPERFLALLFLPLACNYYRLPSFPQPKNVRSALVIPEVTNLKMWVRQRQEFSARTYRDFRKASAGESALSFLLQEKSMESARQFRVNYCEVYQLGGQPWDPKQSYLKQAVIRVQVTDEILELYDSASQFFPSRVVKKENGETWLAPSKVLPWIADNLVAGRVWYAGFFEFRKANEIYERKGLVAMTEYLNSDEQVLFDAVQGAYKHYLKKEQERAGKQERKIDREQVTDKLIYRFRRPSTQQQFAKALVDFLCQYRRSKALRSVGPQISWWIHQGANWRKARDLTLLAISTYEGKKKDAEADSSEDESEAEVLSPFPR
jgi:CRISPR-associated protein Cas8a1/Csx13